MPALVQHWLGVDDKGAPWRENHTTVGYIILGSALSAVSIIGLLLNCLLIAVILTQGFLKKGNGSILYRPTFSLLVSDSIILLIVACYIGPTCAMESELLKKTGTMPKFPGFLLQWMWYETWAMLSVIAWNRYVGIVHHDKYYYISRRAINAIVLMTWPLTLALCTVGFWGFECCKMMIYYDQCGPAYSYWNGTHFFVAGQLKEMNITRWTAWLIDLPGQLLTSLTLAFCYGSCYITVRRAYAKMRHAVTPTVQERRQMFMWKLGIQFSAISIIFTLIWFSFIFVTIGHTSAMNHTKAITTALLILHSTINSIFYLTFNKDIQAKTRVFFGRGRPEDYDYFRRRRLHRHLSAPQRRPGVYKVMEQRESTRPSVQVHREDTTLEYAVDARGFLLPQKAENAWMILRSHVFYSSEGTRSRCRSKSMKGASSSKVPRHYAERRVFGDFARQRRVSI